MVRDFSLLTRISPDISFGRKESRIATRYGIVSSFHSHQCSIPPPADPLHMNKQILDYYASPGMITAGGK